MPDQGSINPAETAHHAERQRRRYQRELKERLMDPREVFLRFISDHRPALLQDLWDTQPAKRDLIRTRAKQLLTAWNPQKSAIMNAYLYDRKSYQAIGMGDEEVGGRPLCAATVRTKVIQAVSFYVQAMHQAAAEAQRVCDEARKRQEQKHVRPRRPVSTKPEPSRVRRARTVAIPVAK